MIKKNKWIINYYWFYYIILLIFVLEYFFFFKRGFFVSNIFMIVMYDIYLISGILSKYLKINILSNNIEIFVVDVKLDIIYFVDSRSILFKKYNIII